MTEPVIGYRTNSLPTRVQHKLDEYLLCGCCENHDVGKQSVWKPLNCTHAFGTFGNSTPNCNCSCWRLSHILCMLHPESQHCLTRSERLTVISQILETPHIPGGLNTQRVDDIGVRQQIGVSGVWG